MKSPNLLCMRFHLVHLENHPHQARTSTMGMYETTTGRKRRHSEGDDDYPLQSSPQRRRVAKLPTERQSCDEDEHGGVGLANGSDYDQMTGLASRIDMLEDLLFQLRDTPRVARYHSNSRVHHRGLCVTIRDWMWLPIILPDWASRARQHAKAKGLVQVPRPSVPDDSHEMLEMTLRNLEDHAVTEQLSLPHEDDDLVIRGLLHGWDSAAQTHKLDTVWRFLRMFDLCLYKPMSAISRLAALRALRAMLVHRIQPSNQALRPIPPFFAPTPLQQTEKHSSLIDYFAWPSVRDHLIKTSRDIRSIPRVAQTKFAQNFVFDWPYEFSDAFMTVKASGRLVFSEDFNKRWNDLHYWTITAFDDTSFIPTHLQLDRKQLTRCGDCVSKARYDHGSAVSDGRSRLTSVTPQASRCMTWRSDRGQFVCHREGQMSAAQSSPSSPTSNCPDVLPEREVMEPEALSKSLDEWSWNFTDAQETYDTLRSLINMPVPS